MEAVAKIEVYEYQGAQVTFEADGDSVWVNATQMAKPYGREPYQYLRTERAQGLIAAWKRDPQNCGTENFEPTRTVRGENAGTWLHKDLAADFAQWLNPDLGLWCGRKLHDLLTKGVAHREVPQDPILAMLQAVTEVRKDQLAMGSRIAKLEEKEAARADVVALLPSVPEKTNRARLTEIMESHGGRIENYREGWKTLYAEYERRYHVDISTRAKNAKLSGPHWAEKNGHIDNLLALAVKLFG